MDGCDILVGLFIDVKLKGLETDLDLALIILCVDWLGCAEDPF